MTSASLVLLILVNPYALAESKCEHPRPAKGPLALKACEGQTTCLHPDAIGSLGRRGYLPRTAGALEKARFEICQDEARRRKWEQYRVLNPLIEALAYPEESKKVVRLIDKIKERVNGALKDSRQHMDLVSQCIKVFGKVEAYSGSDGSLDGPETTRRFGEFVKTEGGRKAQICSIIWSKALTRSPVLNVVQEELTNSRIYLALSHHWRAPDEFKRMVVPKPTDLLVGQSVLYEGVPDQIPGLSSFEVTKVNSLKSKLKEECKLDPGNSCENDLGLESYARKRYHQTVSENPILLYFSAEVDPSFPIKARDLSEAYGRLRENRNSLAAYKLNDLDYLKFSNVVDSILREDFSSNERGDYCEIAAALLASFEYDQMNKDAAFWGIAGAGVAGGLVTAVPSGARLALGARMSAAYGMAKAGLVVYGLNQIVDQFTELRKAEALCSQAHLKMSELCDTNAIAQTASDLKTPESTLALQAAFGLGGRGIRALKAWRKASVP